jgi:hypothetical protein
MLRNQEPSAPFGPGLRAPSPPRRGERNQGRYGHRAGTTGSDFSTSDQHDPSQKYGRKKSKETARKQPEEAMDESEEDIPAAMLHQRHRRKKEKVATIKEEI